MKSRRLILYLFLAALLSGGTAAVGVASDSPVTAPSLKSIPVEKMNEVVRALAPRLWFSKRESFYPLDPREFIRQSSLWLRHGMGRDTKLASLGSVRPEDLVAPRSGGASGRSTFLKFEGPTKWDPHERHQIDDPNAPLLWRLSESAVAHSLGKAPPGKTRVLIEFWYHLAFNYATWVGIGNHQGEWESFAVVADLTVAPSRDQISAEPRAVYLSQHTGGKWYCLSEIEKTAGRFDFYSAIGTHATYPHAGAYSKIFFIDHAERGVAWESWKNIRPLEKESYYGYSGDWGASRLLNVTSAPIGPAPGFKAIAESDPSGLARILSVCL